jgi:endoglucanase Acf2
MDRPRAFFSFFVSGNVTFRWLDQADKKYGTFIGADEKYRTFIEKLPLTSGRRNFRGETFVGSG